MYTITGTCITIVKVLNIRREGIGGGGGNSIIFPGFVDETQNKHSTKLLLKFITYVHVLST